MLADEIFTKAIPSRNDQDVFNLLLNGNGGEKNPTPNGGTLTSRKAFNSEGCLVEQESRVPRVCPLPPSRFQKHCDHKQEIAVNATSFHFDCICVSSGKK